MSSFKMDKTAIAFHRLGKAPKAYEYWIKQSYEKRLSAIEYLRQQYHSENVLQSGLQRVYSIAKRSPG